MSGITCPFCGETEKYWGRAMEDTRLCSSCGKKVSEEEYEVLIEGGDATNESGGKEASISTKSAERKPGFSGDQVKASYESAKEHLNENPRLPFKIGLGVSCLCLTTFGGLILDNATGRELVFYQAAMISSAVMVHLFASLLFRDNRKT
jgi:hypothetical protein